MEEPEKKIVEEAKGLRKKVVEENEERKGHGEGEWPVETWEFPQYLNISVCVLQARSIPNYAFVIAGP